MPVFKNKKEAFFRKWTPEMAYVLGFFVADGCMIKNKRGGHFIEFQITDKDILLKIRKLLGSNHKIAERKGKENEKLRYKLQIGSKKIFMDLLALSLTERKSKTMALPAIPDKYFSHFLRGYFDGDGNVYIHKRKDRKGKSSLLSGFTSGSKIFLEDLLLNLKRYFNINGGTLYQAGGAYRLYFSTLDSIKLHDLMYKESESLFLARKKQKFEEFIKNK